MCAEMAPVTPLIAAPKEPKPKVQMWEHVLPPGLWVQALCIGINTYKAQTWVNLENCISDAEGIAESVKGLPASKVEPVCQNPITKLALRTAVRDFLVQIDKQKPPRIVLVFFAGHGVQEADQIYLVPAHADPANREQLKQQCVSHDELFHDLKQGLDDHIQVSDVVYLVIMDACRSSLGSKEKNLQGFSAEIHEPLSHHRPQHWVLCTSSSRRATALDGDGSHSPFTKELLSSKCGLFRQNVQLEHALKVAIRRLEAQGEQQPCLMPAHNIPESLCLHQPDLRKPKNKDVDVFLCFREGGVDGELAGKLRDKLKAYQVGERGALSPDPHRPLRVFFEPGLSTLLAMEQVAHALHSSSVILVLVSHTTFEGLAELHEDSVDHPLSSLFCRYDMILELRELGRHCVVPILVGAKTERVVGRPEYETFDERQDNEKFWPVATAPEVIVKQILENVLDGLRYNFEVARSLDDKMLKSLPQTPSILRGRTIRQTLHSLGCRDNFRPLPLEGPEDRALEEICRRIHALVAERECPLKVGTFAHPLCLAEGKKSAEESTRSEEGDGGGVKRPRLLTQDKGRGDHDHKSTREGTDIKTSSSTNVDTVELGTSIDGTSIDASYTWQPVQPIAQVGQKRARENRKTEAMMTSEETSVSDNGLTIVRLGESGHANLEQHPSDPLRVAAAGTCSSPELLGSVFKYHVFISHNWGTDEEGRDNHERAKKLNSVLQQSGFETWFDEERMEGNIKQQMASGIELSVVVLVCVTLEYMRKIMGQNANDNCKLEFDYAAYYRGAENMVPVVMEEGMSGTKWQGNLGFTLGSHLYFKLTSDLDEDFRKSVDIISGAIRKKLRPEKVLWNQQALIASHFDTAPPSPISYDSSEIQSIPASPVLDDSEQILAFHVHHDVSQFRKNMKELMKDFLSSFCESPPGEKPHLGKFKLCEMLLVAFMRDKIAPSCDTSVFENLECWQEKCENPMEDLIKYFHKFMSEPELESARAVLSEIGYQFADKGKPPKPEEMYSSIFVINWMVQLSPWKLPIMKRNDWTEHVVKQWFEVGDTETAASFLGRGEEFLRNFTTIKDESWGGRILGKVIEIKSYVVFWRFESLSALLLREHSDLRKIRQRQMAVKGSSQHAVDEVHHKDCEPEHGGSKSARTSQLSCSISLVVSSNDWHLILRDDKTHMRDGKIHMRDGKIHMSPSHTQLSAIVYGLRILLGLPSQLLDTHSLLLTQVDRVQVNFKRLQSATAALNCSYTQLPIECLLEHVCTYHVGSAYPQLLLSYGMVCRTWRKALQSNLHLLGSLNFDTFSASVSLNVMMKALKEISSKNLRFLDMSGCSKLDANDMEAIMSQLCSTCPGVVEVKMTGCQNEAILRAVGIRFAEVFDCKKGQEFDATIMADRIKLLSGAPASSDPNLEGESIQSSAYERDGFREELSVPRQQCDDDEQNRLKFAAVLSLLGEKATLPRLQFDEDPVPAQDAVIQAAKRGFALDVALLLHVTFSGADTGTGSQQDIAIKCNMQEKEGKYAIHYAAERGDVQMIQVLMNAGAHLDPESFAGTTPIMSACLEGRSRAVDFLLQHKGNPNAVRLSDGCTPLSAALYACSKDVGGGDDCLRLVLRQQLRQVPVVDQLNNSILSLARAACDIQNVSTWLSSGIDIRSLQAELGCLVLCCQRLDYEGDENFEDWRKETLALASDLREIQVFLNRNLECLLNENLPSISATFLQLVSQESDSNPFSKWKSHKVMNSVFKIACVNAKDFSSPYHMIWNAMADSRGGSMSTMKYSPSNFQVAYASANSVIVRDAISGVVVRELTGHQDYIYAVAYSEDGCKLASGSNDNTLRLWDLTTGQQIGKPLAGHSDVMTAGAWAVAWRSDSKMVASSARIRNGVKGGVEIWDVENCTLHMDVWYNNHDESGSCILFHPCDLNVIFCCSVNHGIIAVNIDTGAIIYTLAGHSNRVNSLAISPSSTTIVSCAADKTIRVWDYSKGSQIGEPLCAHTGNVSTVAFSLDGTKLASASWDKKVQFWDPQTWLPIGVSIPCHKRWVTSLSFAPDGKSIATCGAENTIQFRDISFSNPLRNCHKAPVTKIVLSPHRRSIISRSKVCDYRFWEAASGLQLEEKLFLSEKQKLATVDGHHDVASLAELVKIIGTRIFDAEAMLRVLMHCTVTANNIVDIDSITCIVGIMEHHVGHANVQQQACRVLSLLAFNEDNRVSMAEAGCIERILTAMGAHVDDTDLQEKASLALRNLSVNAANKVAIAAADGIQRIVDAMRAHSSHTDLQEELCLALYVLSDNDDTVSTSLAKVDGVEVFADMIATSESCDNLNYTISTQGDLILWHHRLSAESRFEGPFYRCPAPISAIRSSGDMVVAGCESGQVVILQTSLPNSLSVSDRTSDRVMG